jgi:hypothetical protein
MIKLGERWSAFINTETASSSGSKADSTLIKDNFVSSGWPSG